MLLLSVNSRKFAGMICEDTLVHVEDAVSKGFSISNVMRDKNRGDARLLQHILQFNADFS